MSLHIDKMKKLIFTIAIVLYPLISYSQNYQFEITEEFEVKEKDLSFLSFSGNRLYLYGSTQKPILFCGFEGDAAENSYTVNSMAVRSDGSTDDVQIIFDDSGAYSSYLYEYGCQAKDQVNRNFLQWKSGGNVAGRECAPQDASLMLDGFNLKSGVGYMLEYCVSSIEYANNLIVGIFHKTPDGLKPVTGTGISQDGYLDNRVIYPTLMETNTPSPSLPYWGYWIRESLMFMTDADYDDCCIRFSFVSPERITCLDNIVLYDSTLCSVRYNGDKAQIKFLPQTDIGKKTAVNSSVELPLDCISVTAVDEGKFYDLALLTVEYHADGCLYFWLDDEFIGYDDIKVSFMNPTDNPDLALQYIESIDTQKGDTVWRYMPDLMDVAAFPDYELPAIVKPDNTLKYTSLDVSNDVLQSDCDEISVTFSVPLAEDFSDLISIRLVDMAGAEEQWHVDSYIARDDEDRYTVVFKRDSQNSQLLYDFYDFHIDNIKYFRESDLWLKSYRLPAYFGNRFDGMKLGIENKGIILQPGESVHYGLDGKVIPKDRPGLHIIRETDGKVRKVLVR